ncbi:MAG: DinB/UmuC family translesion DNA polymerase, partial [Microbacterium gubbeenense]
ERLEVVEADLEASGVAIKVRFDDFQTLTRSQALTDPTSVGQRIAQVARDLLSAVDLRAPVRLIGVRAERLVPAGSAALALWDDDGEWKQVDGALDKLAQRFGTGSITRAAFLTRDQHLPDAERPAEDSD